MSFPKALRIFGRVWRVVRRLPGAMKGNAGLCDRFNLRMSVATGQTEFDTRDTVLHEVMHAVLADQTFTRTAEDEERYVLPLASGLLAVLHDNPDFAAWLIAPIKPPKD